jgi:hypothetical protein
MKGRYFIVGISLVSLLGIEGGIQTAAAHDIPIKSTFAGTFLSTQIDAFPPGGDGLPAVWGISEVKSNLGGYTGSGVVEEVAGTPDPTNCPGGVGKINAAGGEGGGSVTATFPNGRDQIYFQILTRTACVNATGGFSVSDTGKIVGGAGKFAGASGTFEQSFSGFYQAFDPSNFQGSGSFTGEGKGTLTLPDGNSGH